MITSRFNIANVTVTRSAFDNYECHVTAFRPISKQLIVDHTTVCFDANFSLTFFTEYCALTLLVGRQEEHPACKK